MHTGRLLLVLALTSCLPACESRPDLSVDIVEPMPTAVNCGDATRLREQAAHDRRRVEQTRSDHERISVGSRANFLASLAVIADLKCKVAVAEGDDTLKAALEAARHADANHSVYESTNGFNAANFKATQVVEALLGRLGR